MLIDLEDLVEAFILNRYAVLIWLILGLLGLLLSVILRHAREIIL